MITVTQEAAEQIRKSEQESKIQGLHLRIAARREADGTFQYGMGFDEAGEEDTQLVSEGVNILISNSCKELLTGATLDFGEIAPGEHNFIFINPNDPSHGPHKGKTQ